jgi:hypothetical protein
MKKENIFYKFNSKAEQWLFDPKNKVIVQKLKKALKQKADRIIDLSGLEKVASKKYVAGIRIPNDTYADRPVNPIHMTIAYMGAADHDKLERAQQLLAELNAMRPIHIKVGAPDLFGTQRRPVPVRMLALVDPAVHKKCMAIYKELAVPEPYQTKQSDSPLWHVALRREPIQKEFAAKENTILMGGALFVKQIGSFEPIAEFE